MFSVSSVIRAHHASLLNEGGSRVRVLTVIYAPSIAATGGVAVAARLFPAEVTLGTTTTDPLIAAFALLSAILFGLSLTVLDKAIDTDLSGPPPGASTDRSAHRLQALSANTLYTSMVAAIATGILVAGEIFPSIACAATATGVGAMVLVGTNGALIVSRVYRETKWRTDRARTGESRRLSGYSSDEN